MNPILLALDIGIFIYMAGFLYGIYSKRIFFGRWIYLYQEKRKYVDAAIAYLIIIVGVIFIRFLLSARLYG